MKKILKKPEGLRTKKIGLLLLMLVMMMLIGISLSACGNGSGEEGEEQSEDAGGGSEEEGGEEASSLISITKEPEDITVSYPEGAEFSLEVNSPDDVESYQWVMEDQAGNVFVLEGLSAKTEKLIVPSTSWSNAAFTFYCIITDKEGNEIRSKEAILDTDNKEEYKPVFYVGEYALEPGESMDLASVEMGEGKTLGSGTVTFDANAKDITFDNVNFDNTYWTAGHVLAPNVGLDFEFYQPDKEEYNMIFQGENNIMNTYYDPDYNSSGIPFDICFSGIDVDEEAPLVNFKGDGNLTITNGSNALRVIGDMMIGIDISIRASGTNYGDGIAANSILLSEGKKLDLQVNGTGVKASGNFFTKDAEIVIASNTPKVSMGIVTKNIISAENTASFENTLIDIKSTSDHEVCGNVAGNIGIFANGEMYVTAGSRINYEIEVKEADELYASNFIGMSAYMLSVENSEIEINMDAPDLFYAMGVYAEEYIEFNKSDVAVNVNAAGPVYGIAPEGDFSAEDSNVDINVKYNDAYGVFDPCGITCENMVLMFTDEKYQVRSKAEGGVGAVCSLIETGDETWEYQEGYESKNVFYRDSAACVLPENNVISIGTLGMGEGNSLKVETWYDAADHTKPAEEVIFKIKR